MPYNNDVVPEHVQQKLDHINNIEANAKLAAGAKQYGKFMLQTWSDVSSFIVPLEGAGVVIKSELNASRLRLATKTYRANGIEGRQLLDHLKYIDYGENVLKGRLEEGTELIQFRLKNQKGVGDYYEPKGTLPQEIGLDPSDVDWSNSFDVKLDFRVDGNLFSKHAKNKPLYYDPKRSSVGGGTQIYNPEIKKYATFTKIKRSN